MIKIERKKNWNNEKRIPKKFRHTYFWKQITINGKKLQKIDFLVT